MKYRFSVLAFSRKKGFLFSAFIDMNSAQDVAKHYLGRYYDTRMGNSGEKIRITCIEIHSQIPLTRG